MRSNYIYSVVARKFPELSLKLEQAERKETPEQFVKKIFNASIFIGASIFIFLGALLLKFEKPLALGVVAAIFTGILGFFYLMKIPDYVIIKYNKGINKELVYAGKFLIVELNAGVTLYDAMRTVAENYPNIGRHLGVMINEVDLGTSLDAALNNLINRTTSQNFRKFLWQILNAQQTGADIGSSLITVLEQIQRDQQIEIEKYGKKLNPVAMFYLMVAVVLPSLGMVMFIIVASFLSINMSLIMLLILVGVFTFIQFMFLAIIKSMRPAVQL